VRRHRMTTPSAEFDTLVIKPHDQMDHPE
jgi:hypothetical protein